MCLAGCQYFSMLLVARKIIFFFRLTDFPHPEKHQQRTANYVQFYIPAKIQLISLKYIPIKQVIYKQSVNCEKQKVTFDLKQKCDKNII